MKKTCISPTRGNCQGIPPAVATRMNMCHALSLTAKDEGDNKSADLLMVDITSNQLSAELRGRSDIYTSHHETQTDIVVLSAGSAVELLQTYHLPEIKTLEANMKEEKSDFESLYQELSKEAFLRVRNVQHLQKEIDWLKSESRKLSEQCRHLGVGRINHTKSIKHLLQCILDKDIVEVEQSIPLIYNQYTSMRTLSNTEQLLADINLTRKSLDKFEILTRTAQQRLRRGESLGNKSSKDIKLVGCDETMNELLNKLRKNIELKITSRVRMRSQRVDNNNSVRGSIAYDRNISTHNLVNEALETAAHHQSDNVQGLTDSYGDVLTRQRLPPPPREFAEPEADDVSDPEDDILDNPIPTEHEFAIFEGPQAFL